MCKAWRSAMTESATATAGTFLLQHGDSYFVNVLPYRRHPVLRPGYRDEACIITIVGQNAASMRKFLRLDQR